MTKSIKNSQINYLRVLTTSFGTVALWALFTAITYAASSGKSHRASAMTLGTQTVSIMFFIFAFITVMPRHIVSILVEAPGATKRASFDERMFPPGAWPVQG